MTEGQMRVGADAMRGFCQAVFERAGVPWPL